MLNINLMNKECLEMLNEIPNNSIDFVCIDPPYTDGKGNDVLKGHKIQTKLDLQAVANELYRVAKPNTFYAFFGQMPTIIEWYNAAVKAGFKFRNDIIWCKRNSGVGNENRINRTHESIYIMQKGTPKWNKLNQKWEDVSQELCEVGLMNIENIFRVLSYWKGIAQGKNLVNTVDSFNNRSDNFHTKGALINDRGKPMLGRLDVNLTTIWSFMPHNCANKNPITGQIKHPTVKPIPLLERLIELCTPESENIIVLDCFAGSGTTALACQNTNRNFIGCEIDLEYYNICNQRINKNADKLSSILL